MTSAFDRRAQKDLRKPGIAGWLLAHFHSDKRPQPRLTILERVTLAPRQSLTLIEAEGRTLLVATSPDCAPTFFALDERNSHHSNDPSAADIDATLPCGIVADCSRRRDLTAWYGESL
jgi:Flagellar biosynthesis protein, FliO